MTDRARTETGCGSSLALNRQQPLGVEGNMLAVAGDDHLGRHHATDDTLTSNLGHRMGAGQMLQAKARDTGPIT